MQITKKTQRKKNNPAFAPHCVDNTSYTHFGESRINSAHINTRAKETIVSCNDLSEDTSPCETIISTEKSFLKEHQQKTYITDILSFIILERDGNNRQKKQWYKWKVSSNRRKCDKKKKKQTNVWLLKISCSCVCLSDSRYVVCGKHAPCSSILFDWNCFMNRINRRGDNDRKQLGNKELH